MHKIAGLWINILARFLDYINTLSYIIILYNEDGYLVIMRVNLALM